MPTTPRGHDTSTLFLVLESFGFPDVSYAFTWLLFHVYVSHKFYTDIEILVEVLHYDK